MATDNVDKGYQCCCGMCGAVVLAELICAAQVAAYAALAAATVCLGGGVYAVAFALPIACCAITACGLLKRNSCCVLIGIIYYKLLMAVCFVFGCIGLVAVINMATKSSSFHGLGLYQFITTLSLSLLSFALGGAHAWFYGATVSALCHVRRVRRMSGDYEHWAFGGERVRPRGARRATVSWSEDVDDDEHQQPHGGHAPDAIERIPVHGRDMPGPLHSNADVEAGRARPSTSSASQSHVTA